MGPALCFASAVGFGLMAIFAKSAYAEGVSVDTLLVVRFALAAGVLMSLSVARGLFRGLTRRSVLVGLAMGAVGYAAQAGLYLAAVSRVDASQAALVFSVYPVTVMVAAVLIGREYASRRRLAALGFAMTGIALVLGGSSGAGAFDPLGSTLALGSALVYTCYILVGDRVIGDVPAVPLTALICTGALATCTAISLLLGGPDLSISPAGWGWLLALAAISTVGAILLFFAGLARTGPTVAALVCIVEPVVTVVSAALTFGEQLSPAQGLGGLLVLAAVAVVQAPGTSRVDRGGTPVVASPPVVTGPQAVHVSSGPP